VVEWLEEVAQFTTEFEKRGEISLRKTLRSIQQARAGPRLVDALDPDAVFRQERAVETEDVEEEEALLQYLWQFIRCGELEKAIELSRQFKQNWRAAALNGGALWHDEQKADAAGSVWGNRKRTLWKQACRALAERSGASVCEQAIFGALGGDVAKTLANCVSWEDNCWAYFKTMVDTIVDDKLRAEWLARPDVKKTHFTADRLDLSGAAGAAGAAAAVRDRICDSADTVFQKLETDRNPRVRYVRG
jgi:hypothetical protein